MFEGAFIWLVACRMPEIAGSVALRAVLSAAIIATYTWLAAAEIWRNSESHLVSRIPASFMLFAHGALFQLRTPLAVLMPHPPGTEPIFGSVWLTVLSSEALLFTIAIAFVVMAMAKERTAYVHKTAALIDPLTGIWNRRGFMVRRFIGRRSAAAIGSSCWGPIISPAATKTTYRAERWRRRCAASPDARISLAAAQPADGALPCRGSGWSSSIAVTATRAASSPMP